MTLLPPETRSRTQPLWIVGTVLSIAVAIVSYRYLVGIGPLPEGVTGNAFANPWLVVHVASSATALLIGSFQFVPRLRARQPGYHRWSGRLYVLCCVLGGVSGQVLAWGTTAGPVATAGFGLVSVAWLWTTLRGLQLALDRDFVRHRQWMIRSWSLTLAAVTLRIQLGVSGALDIPFETAYPIISFVSWVPNLVVAELYLMRERRRSAVRNG
jgi:uncharacterized membrane protein